MKGTMGHPLAQSLFIRRVTAATAAQAVDEQCECHPSGHVFCSSLGASTVNMIFNVINSNCLAQ
jgi:hypothetical protein